MGGNIEAVPCSGTVVVLALFMYLEGQVWSEALLWSVERSLVPGL